MTIYQRVREWRERRRAERAKEIDLVALEQSMAKIGELAVARCKAITGAIKAMREKLKRLDKSGPTC